MLPSKELHFRFATGVSGRSPCQYETASGFEDPFVVEDQLDPYGAFQTLGFRDPGNGNESRILLADEATPKSQA